MICAIGVWFVFLLAEEIDRRPGEKRDVILAPFAYVLERSLGTRQR